MRFGRFACILVSLKQFLALAFGLNLVLGHVCTMQKAVAVGSSTRQAIHQMCEKKMCKVMSSAHAEEPENSDCPNGNCPLMQEPESLSFATKDGIPDMDGAFSSSLLTQALLVLGAPSSGVSTIPSLFSPHISTVVMRQ